MAVIREKTEYLLRHLKRMGLGGQSVNNIAAFSLDEMEPQDFADSLRALEKSGYVQIYGQRTLDDFYVLLDKKTPSFVSLEQQTAAKTAGDTNHYRLIDGDRDFFNMSARITLRGRFALATGHISLADAPNAGFDLAKAAQKLEEKKSAEQQAKERERPAKVFGDILGAEIRKAMGTHKDEWKYDIEYWKDEEWKADELHNRLMASNPEYKKAFDSCVKAQAKFERVMDRHEDKITEGSLLSRIAENPFTRMLIVGIFAAAAHPFSSGKFGRSLKTLQTIYLDQRRKEENAPPPPA